MALTITPTLSAVDSLTSFSLSPGHTVDVDASTYTLLDDNSGMVHVINQDCTITLPATNGGSFLCVAARSGIDMIFSPQSADLIMGAGDTAADDKDLSVLQMNAGDYVWLIGSDADGYRVLLWRYTGKGVVSYLA